ncbi:hypothetical protein BDZ89DRAFT_1073141 [Hymenopellis radicata]|nr:hypothetical protein BDZ89DRAFT_1073141 [Hymenopellis radicata]
MPAAKPPAAKRRNRKRKRRAASSSSSSADSSESDSESQVEPPKPLPPPKIAPSDHESSSESSSESDSSDSDSDVFIPAAASITTTTKTQPQRSPSPPPAQIPSFIPEKTASPNASAAELEVKFRKFWMTAVADGFSGDLDELRKESNLSKSRLEMLVHSLASGTEVFSKDEMEVVLG